MQRFWGWGFVLLTGCPADPPAGAGPLASVTASGPAASAPVAAAVSAPAASGTAPPAAGSVVSLPVVPPTAAERQRPTHLLPEVPSEAPPCKPLPASPAGLARELARLIRQLACTPSLFYQTHADAEAALALPAGVTFRFSGPRSADLELKSAPTAAALAKAIGVDKPVITTAKSGAWATRNWFLGSNPETGDLDVWGPGEALVAVSHQGELKDSFGTVKPLTDEQLRGYVTVRMPEQVVKVRDDEVALRMLIHAVTLLTKQPQLVEQEPEQVAKTLGLDDPRFRVSRVTHTSVNTDAKVHGLDIWVERTQIASEPVVRTFALPGEISHSRARDSDDYVLYDADRDAHAYRGLVLTPTFEPRSGLKGRTTSALKDYTLQSVRIMR